MIATPYLDGIQTHRSRVTPLMKQVLYLQATTAGYRVDLFAKQFAFNF